jgi:hypothetical protein
MPRTPDLNSAIATIVAAEVARSLEPYRHVLERVEAFIGGAPRRGPGRPRKNPVPVMAVPPVAARTRRRRRGRPAAGGDVSKFADGQTVRYRQGRGEFEATVISIDKQRNVLTLRRVSDKKEVDRPPSKVYTA